MLKQQNLILFLDIDGVMNTKNHLRRQARNGKKPSRFDWCPVAAAHIKLLTEKLGARIVVTSTWRYEFGSFEELREIFEKNEINPDHVIGKTSSLLNEDGPVTRGQEIRAWIEENNAQHDLHIILDDNDDGISERFLHFIQTSMEEGFAAQEKIKMALKIIKGL